MFAGLREAAKDKVASNPAFDFHSRQAALAKLDSMDVQVQCNLGEEFAQTYCRSAPRKYYKTENS